MRLVYSLWTEPLKHSEKRQRQTKWLYGLSIAYAKKLGYDTVLHTDDLGYQLLKNLPFDKIKITLNNLNEDPEFWSYPKIMALKLETAPFIHIDGDAWIKSKHLKEVLETSDFDVAVQMIEDGELWDSGYQPFSNEIAKHCEAVTHLQWSEKKAYNTGIMAFKNETLKTLFINNYERMLRCLKDYEYKSQSNVLIEQFNLFSICHANNFKVFKLLDFSKSNKNINALAKEIGFTHLWGKSKWEDDVQHQVKERLKLINYDIYNHCLAH